ncbi:unnamed protein product [Symbiodinium natans]|uniref:Uncharacterized protein n=1 Tax=Symbiodinium natans TaxID=878477 RepID=A0A812T4N1_9DINO|nr:unnamed protein product [Symbiodinium natans]
MADVDGVPPIVHVRFGLEPRHTNTPTGTTKRFARSIWSRRLVDQSLHLSASFPVCCSSTPALCPIAEWDRRILSSSRSLVRDEIPFMDTDIARGLVMPEVWLVGSHLHGGGGTLNQIGCAGVEAPGFEEMIRSYAQSEASATHEVGPSFCSWHGRACATFQASSLKTISRELTSAKSMAG